MRLGKATVFERVPKSGQYAATFECVVNECDGRVCCNLRKVYQ